MIEACRCVNTWNGSQVLRHAPLLMATDRWAGDRLRWPARGCLGGC